MDVEYSPMKNGGTWRVCASVQGVLVRHIQHALCLGAGGHAPRHSGRCDTYKCVFCVFWKSFHA